MAQPKFTISLLGFDERSAEFLSKEARKTMSIIDPISKNDTQVVVVDIDEPNGIATWNEFREQWPHMPAVVTASDEPDIDDASFAEKPFTVEGLIDSITEAIILFPSAEEIASETGETDETTSELEALELEHESPTDIAAETDNVDEVVASEETHETPVTPGASDESIKVPESENEMPPLSEIAGSLETSTPTGNAIFNRAQDTTNPDANYFDPDAHIIGLVLKGITNGEKTGAIAKLRCLLDRTIYIDARNKLVRSNLKEIHMRQISIAPLGKGEHGLDTELEMIESESLEELSDKEGSTYPLETFVWELAILTSQGRAPVGTPMDKPTYLMQWPNFTRLMHIPNDMKVAAYWLSLPSSLYDLSDNLNIPMNDILLLYSAASLTGLAGIARRKSDHFLKPSKPEEHENRSLFGSIIDRLSKH